MGIKVIEFRGHTKGTLLGFMTISTPSGYEIKDLSLHAKNGKRRINFPSKTFTGEDGKTVYVPLIKIPDADRMARFQAEVSKAIDLFRPPEKKEAQDDSVPF